MSFKEISPFEIDQNPFKLIGKDWMLITAEKDGKVNTMTASWGGLGVIWNKNVVYIVLRPQRYTKEFIDGSDTFSLTFFDDSFKKELRYLGKVSGKNEDKIGKSGLTIEHIDGTPYFKEGNMTIVCKKLFGQKFSPENFYDKELMEENYPNKDYHTMYIGEIVKVIRNEK